MTLSGASQVQLQYWEQWRTILKYKTSKPQQKYTQCIFLKLFQRHTLKTLAVVVSHDCYQGNCPDKDRGKEIPVIHSNLSPWRALSPLSVKKMSQGCKQWGPREEGEKKRAGKWRKKFERSHKVSQRGMICGSWVHGSLRICLFLFITRMTWSDWLPQPDSALADWAGGWMDGRMDG